MQPCNYTKTLTTAESKITKIIALGNIRFYRNKRNLRHDKDIENANWVNITFEYQKNDDRNESVGIYRSNHQRLCPVLLWSKIVTPVQSYKGTDPHTKLQLNTFMDKKGKRFTITSTGILIKLWAAVQILGK